MIFPMLIDGGDVVILVERKRQTQRNVILKQSDYIFLEGQELEVQTIFVFLSRSLRLLLLTQNHTFSLVV